MSAKKAAKDSTKQQNFETSLARLEAIVKDMEAGSLDLEEMIARFEEGQTLLAFCTEKLNEVEKKIEVLVRKGGKLTTEPFDAPGKGKNGKASGGELF